MKVLIKRKLDSKSRINIPAEVLEVAKLKPGDEFSFELSKTGAIVIRKVDKSNDNDSQISNEN